MNEGSVRDRDHRQAQIKKPARVAARDPALGAKNRPGFDLGGAVGDAKPDDKNRTNSSTEQARSARKKEARNVAGDARIKAKGKADYAAGRVRSAVTGVRNWLRGK